MVVQVLDITQLFTAIDGGGIKFAYTQVTYIQNGMTFCARLPYKTSKHEVGTEGLENARCISSTSYQPLHTSQYTIAPNADDCFVKKPNLTSYEHEEDITKLVLKELQACEIIRKRPHPNIAEYYGCKVSDGRIEGLCFKRYRVNMMDAINPNNLNKSMFICATERATARKKAALYLPGVEAGILHLHSVGLVHNDINPSNIMLDNSGIITDFDSVRAPGEALDKVKRTYGWHNPEVCVSQESNDLDALAELRIWLTSSSPADLRFGW